MANRHALLIGNAEYEDKALRKLKAPDHLCIMRQ